jgi:predicted MFS family arabinose efflux permease
VALALIFITGVLDGPALIALISIRQRLAPPHLRAQIFTTASSFHSAVLAAGAAGAGLVHSAFGTDATLLTFAALIAAAGMLALFSQYEAPGAKSAAVARE